jgi:hypothetical protein
MRSKRNLYLIPLVTFSVLSAAALYLRGQPAVGQSSPAITVSSSVPGELNPTGGGAPAATPEQASAFAWQRDARLPAYPAGPSDVKPQKVDAIQKRIDDGAV